MIFKVGKCNKCGYCCEHMIYGVLKDDPDRLSYLQYHKAVIAVLPGQRNGAMIKCKCEALMTKNGHKLCKWHGTEGQPAMCERWPSCPEDFYEVINSIHPCGYQFVEIDINTPEPMG